MRKLDPVRVPFMALTIALLGPGTSFATDLGGYVHRTLHAPYFLENTIIRLHFDIAKATVFGDEIAIVRPKQVLATLPFNSKQIRYDRITVDGRTAAYSIDEREGFLYVQLPARVPAGKDLRVEFRYSVKPLRGLYFVRPDKAYAGVEPQIWTQGEPTDNRRWFPTWDQPNQKTPSELVITVPRGWAVVGNGYLKSHTQSPSGETWDWNSPRLKSTYLIAFAAGRFVEDRHSLGELDVDSFVQPSLRDLNEICFARTKDMIAYYQDVTGVQFPFEKYDQIAVERFTFGGMEDASNTIVTELALHPAIEEVEDSCDSLVSHELAQHWYGDDASMADWANVWLHEGFATYYEELWTGHRFGVQDFEYARYNAQQTYFAETQQYMRPIVDYKYENPLQLFDASSHHRPAQVLHMLRTMFGDARFFRAMHLYLLEYSYKNADTHQFFASIDKSLGTDLTWFENEWFYRASYPHYYVSESYDDRNQAETLRIEQRNPDGIPFRMPVVIEVFSAGRVRKVEPLLDRNRQTVTIRNVPATPDMVLFDPDNNVLRQLSFTKTVDELIYELAHAAHVGDREWALQQLSAETKAKPDERARAERAVARAVAGDPFWGVRSDAAGVAASFRDAAAVDAALRDRDVRVRIAGENAAASLRGNSAAPIARLEPMANDSNPDVASAALAALGALHAPGAFERLSAALDRPSFQQAVASGALAGLAAECNRRAFDLIKARIVYGTPELERDAAIQALASCAAHLKQPKLALAPLVAIILHDPLIGARLEAANALAALHDKAAVHGLERALHDESQEIVRESVQAALSSLRR